MIVIHKVITTICLFCFYYENAFAIPYIQYKVTGDSMLPGVKFIADNSGLKIVPVNPVRNSYSRQPEEKYSDSSEVLYERQTASDFNVRLNRLAFIRKVYTIFAMQMMSTVCVTGYIMLRYYDVGYFLKRNYRLLSLFGSIGSFTIVSALVSNSKLRHKYPINFILLGLHTFFQSILVGTFCCLIENTKAVCLGTIHTLVALSAITFYSFQPNPMYDLTAKSTVLLTSFCSLLVGIAMSSILNFPLLDNIISAAMAVLSATYIAYDTQKIVGGVHHKHSYGKREYILAALSLYQDVLNYFFQIISLINKTTHSSSSKGDE